jgi:hypothetical protein
MTFEEFARAGKERGFSREDILKKSSEYEEKYGAFDKTGSKSQAILSMNNDVMPSDPDERALIGRAVTEKDKERIKAKRFYDLKFGIDHDLAALNARLHSEYGENAVFEIANQYNSEPLRYGPLVDNSEQEQIEQFLNYLDTARPITDYGEQLPDIKKTGMRLLQDTGVGMAKTIVGTGEALMGLTDLAFMLPNVATQGKIALPSSGFRMIGYDPKKTQEFLSGLYSNETQDALRRVSSEKGVFNKIGMALKNPSVSATTVLESLGPMLLGGGAGRSMAFKSKAISAALGEGFISGGMQLEDIIDFNKTDPVTPKQAALIAGTTVATSLIALGSSSLQGRLGLDDIDVLIAGGKSKPGIIKSPTAKIALSGFFESIVEELPQSIGEQISSNISQDKPWNEKINDSAALGIIAGAVMGVGGGFIGGHSTALMQEIQPSFDDNAPLPYTLGDVNTIRNTMNDTEIEQEVLNLPGQVQQAARDAFLNPSPEKVSRLNSEMFTQPESANEERTIESVNEVSEDDIVGFSTEKINEARAERGEEELSEEDVKSHQKSMTEALESGLDKEADFLADKVIMSAENKKVKTYQMNDKEVAGMGARVVELRNERIRILKRQKAAMDSLDNDMVDQTLMELSQNAYRSDRIETALKTSATQSGRANSMMASLVNRFTYDIVSLESAARISKGKSLTAEEIADIQNVAEKIESVEQKISDLKDQIRTGEFTERKKRIRKDEPQQLTQLRTELNLLQREARNKIYDLRQKTAKDWIKEIATLPRSIMATADMSYGLRQGLLPSFAHPKIAAQAWEKAFTAFFSQKKASQIDVEMRDHPLHTEIASLGTHFSSLDTTIEDRTEFFASNLAEKIPGFGKIVMASERNMVAGINLLRQGLMIDFLTKHPDAGTDVKKAYARYVNIATGRGDAKLLDRSAEELSLIFFAPRFAASRIQAPIEAANLLRHSELRGEIIKQWAAYLGTGLTVLSLAKMAGADIEDDPDDSDWGKIVINNKHIDIWGGMQQPMRILAKAIKGGTERIREGETDVNTISDIGQFLKYKLSPPIVIFNELTSGEDVIGRKTEKIEIGDIELPEIATVFVKNMTPLVIQSAVEAYQEGEDPSIVAALSLGEGLGLSIGVYDKKTK